MPPRLSAPDPAIPRLQVETTPEADPSTRPRAVPSGAFLALPPVGRRRASADSSGSVPRLSVTVALDRAASPGSASAAGRQAEHAARIAASGITEAAFERFVGAHGARFIESASAGKPRRGLNDIAGFLKVPSLDGEVVHYARFPIVRSDGRIFVKGLGDRVLPFGEFESALDRVNSLRGEALSEHRSRLEGDLRQALGSRPWEQPRLESLLMDEVLLLSLRSGLFTRRSSSESADIFTGEPANPTPMHRMTRWANSTAAVPGYGAVQPNGTRQFYIDPNPIEKTFYPFVNEAGGPEDRRLREEALNAQSIPGQRAEILVGGTAHGRLGGVVSWEVVGPASTQSGVKSSIPARWVGAVASAVSGARDRVFGGHAEPGPAAAPVDGTGDDLDRMRPHLVPGAHVLVTLDDGSKHDVRLSDRGISFALRAPGGSPDMPPLPPLIAEVAKTVIDTYAYDAHYNGVGSTPSGMPEPSLQLSTGDALPVGPLLQDSAAASTLAKTLGQLALFQPRYGGPAQPWKAQLFNTTLRAAAKLAVVSGFGSAAHAAKGPDGVFIEGARSFSGVGGQPATPLQLAGSTALIVLSQELATALFDGLSPMLPPGWKKPDNAVLRAGRNFLARSGEEMLRLEINLVVQKLLGLREGSAIDHATLAASSLLKGALEGVRDVLPSPATAPTAHMLLDTAHALQYQALRAFGMAYEAPQHANGLAIDYAEALASRAVLRGYDSIAAPLASALLNRTGVMGPDVDLFDHQEAREKMVTNFFSKFAQATRSASREGDWQAMRELVGDDRLFATLRANLEQFLVGDAEPTGSFSRVDLQRERVKQLLNRVDLYGTQINAFMALASHVVQRVGHLLPGMREPAAQDIEWGAGDAAGRVQRSIALQALDPADRGAALEAMRDAQTGRIAAAEALAAGQPLPQAGPPPTTSTLADASPVQQAAALSQFRELQGRHEALFDASGLLREMPQGRVLQPVVPQPLHVDFRGRRRTEAGRKTVIGVDPHTTIRTASGRPAIPKQRLAKAAGTFSNGLQASAAEPSLAMRAARGLGAGQPTSSARRREPLEKSVARRAEMAWRAYCVESGLLHYPARWQVTGEQELVKLAHGLHLPYNVMNHMGNVQGKRHAKVDPVDHLYANLLFHRTPPLPGELVRAVVTEAAYKPADGQPEQAGDIKVGGSLLVSTEILSASTADGVAGQFIFPIGHMMAVPRNRSQKLDIHHETGRAVNRLADLVQGEVVFTPGAVWRLRHIGQRPPGELASALAQETAQAVYLEQVDTFALEEKFRHFQDAWNEQRPFDPGADPLMIDPYNFQFFRHVARPADGAMLYDPQTKAFYRHDGAQPEPRGGLQFESASKNYFLGRALEYETNPTSQQSVWGAPFTSASVPRTLKDAIHASIVRATAHPGSERIVSFVDELPHGAYASEAAEQGMRERLFKPGPRPESLLDEAVANAHHTHFREKGGFFETATGADGRMRFVHPRAQAEAEHIRNTKLRASKVADAVLGRADYGRPRSLPEVELMAWMLSGLTRRRVLLTAVGPQAGLPADGVPIDVTYDNVDLAQTPLKGIPAWPVAIGVGPDGFHVLHSAQGSPDLASAGVVSGRSAGLTAENLIHAYLLAGTGDLGRRAAGPDASGQVVPGDEMHRTAATLYQTLSRFAHADYFVLQEAMMKRVDVVGQRYAHAPASTRPASMVSALEELVQEERIDEPQRAEEASRIVERGEPARLRAPTIRDLPGDDARSEVTRFSMARSHLSAGESDGTAPRASGDAAPPSTAARTSEDRR